MSNAVDQASTDAYGQQDKSSIPGQLGADIKLGGYIDSTVGASGVETILKAFEQSSTDGILSIIHQTSLNSPGTSAKVQETSLGRTSPIGGVVTMAADFKASDTGVERTQTVFPQGAITPSATGGTTAAYNGGTDTLQGATGWLQALSVAAGTPVVKIEHSEDGATSWSTLITFAAMPLAASAPQAQRATVTGTVKPYKRVSVTGGSATIWVGITQPKA